MDTERNDLTEETKDTVSGIVDTIIFQNEENGYVIALIESEDGKPPVTITGTIPYIREYDRITASGTWVNHKKYGRQFKVDSYEKQLPTDLSDIHTYLASGAVKGIGPKTAAKIISKFGNDSFEVIENHPDWLTDINGITKAKALQISENFKQMSGAKNIIVFCKDFLTTSTAMKIHKKWGGDAIDLIKENPYRLCDEFKGIGFARADAMAMNFGISPDSEVRIINAAKYVLSTYSSNYGHTCMKLNELVSSTNRLLFAGDDKEDLIRTYIATALSGMKFIVQQKEDETYVFLPSAYAAESYSSKKLVKLNRVCPKLGIEDIRLLIRKCETESGIEYASAQREALFTALSDGVMILTGGPGTGKTTIIKGLISIFNTLNFKTVLAAPTGRAAKRMSEATSYEAKTIHRLLEVNFSEDDEDNSSFSRNENNPIDANVIILDESSMIDIYLFSSLLKAVKNGTRLILIGDSDQLPSVGPGNVLGDIIASHAFSVVKLTEIFRQSENSLITVNAHKINQGEMPDISRKDSDFFFINRNSEADIQSAVIELVSSRLPKTYGKSVIDKIQVITPSKKGLSGTQVLNEKLQQALNPADVIKPEKKIRDILFRVGDKIMQTKNDYSVEWTTSRGDEGIGIFNGDIGVITDIDFEDNLIHASFDERQCELDFSMMDNIDHSYAVTVHKSQGSEYPIVIIPIYACAPMLLSRNLLYTAVTRASKMVILVGRRDILQHMVDNNTHSVRNTFLEKFIKEEDRH